MMMSRKNNVFREKQAAAVIHSASNAHHLVEKAVEINLILNEPEVDLWRLREFALTEGGLVNDALRRRVWPKLVGLHTELWQDARTSYTSYKFYKTNKKSKRKKKTNRKTQVDFQLMISSDKSLTALETLQSSPYLLNAITNPNFEEDHTEFTDHSCAGGGHDQSSVCSKASSTSFRDKVLAKSLDFIQIELDTARCTWHLLTGTQRAQRLQMEHKGHKQIARLIQRKQRRLANFLNWTLLQTYNKESLLPSSSSSPDRSKVLKDSKENQKQRNEKTPKRKNGRKGKGKSNGNISRQSSSVSCTEDNNKEALRYYQGYHDVACIILSTLSGTSPVRLRPDFTASADEEQLEDMASALGLDLPSAVLLQLSKYSIFADCCKSNFWDLQTAMQLTLFPLIAYFDPAVHQHLKNCEMEPFFALSWVITWFSHEVRDTEMVKRLFDFFIVSHPLMPIYLSVAMVVHQTNRRLILETECDFSEVHQVLSSLPRNSSMVGWKYRPGDGYVSDDGQDDDDDGNLNGSRLPNEDSISIDADSFVFINEAWTNALNGRDSSAGNDEAVSTVSSSLCSASEYRVPFQELLNTAIKYIEKVPPHQLVRLATKHYSAQKLQQILQPLAEEKSMAVPTVEALTTDPEGVVAFYTAGIQMFQPPPWARIPKCAADWVLLQRQERQRDRQNRQLEGEKTDEGQENLRRRKQSNGDDGSRDFVSSMLKALNNDESDNDEKHVDEDDEDLQRYLEEESKLARIAAGFGTNDDESERRRKKRRNARLMSAAVAIAVVAIAVGVTWHQLQNSEKRAGRNDSRGGDTCAALGTDSSGTVASSSEDRDDATSFRNAPASNTILASSGSTTIPKPGKLDRSAPKDSFSKGALLADSGFAEKQSTLSFDDRVRDSLPQFTAGSGGFDQQHIAKQVSKKDLVENFFAAFRSKSRQAAMGAQQALSLQSRLDLQEDSEEILLRWRADGNYNFDINDALLSIMKDRSILLKSSVLEVRSAVVEHMKVSSKDLIDSTISQGLRDFLKALSRSELMRKLADLKDKQLSVNVRSLMKKAIRKALVQNLDLKKTESDV